MSNELGQMADFAAVAGRLELPGWPAKLASEVLPAPHAPRCRAYALHHADASVSQPPTPCHDTPMSLGCSGCGCRTGMPQLQRITSACRRPGWVRSALRGASTTGIALYSSSSRPRVVSCADGAWLPVLDDERRERGGNMDVRDWYVVKLGYLQVTNMHLGHQNGHRRPHRLFRLGLGRRAALGRPLGGLLRRCLRAHGEPLSALSLVSLDYCCSHPGRLEPNVLPSWASAHPRGAGLLVPHAMHIGGPCAEAQNSMTWRGSDRDLRPVVAARGLPVN